MFTIDVLPSLKPWKLHVSLTKHRWKYMYNHGGNMLRWDQVKLIVLFHTWMWVLIQAWQTFSSKCLSMLYKASECYPVSEHRQNNLIDQGGCTVDMILTMEHLDCTDPYRYIGTTDIVGPFLSFDLRGFYIDKMQMNRVLKKESQH